MKPKILASQRLPGSRAARTGLQRPRPQQQLRKLMLCLGLVLALGDALAAMGDPSSNDPAWLAAARTELKAERFEQAVVTLRAANAVESAEWHNLLGYALRKKVPADLVGAETHYKRALEIDPKHRHALEYYGELFLMKGDLAGAETMLARLNKACFFGCEELRDLKAAIARHKARAVTGK